MKSFTGRTYGGTPMHDYRDGDRVTPGLMELREGVNVIEPDLLFAASLRAGWKGRETVLFWKVAKEVAKGAFRCRGPTERRSIALHGLGGPAGGVARLSNAELPGLVTQDREFS